MAHMQKISKNGVFNMLAHDDRSQENISNVDVDRSLSHLNYSFTSENETGWKRYCDILERMDVHCLNRKDVNTLVSWVITAPKDLPTEKTEEFFKECHRFLVNRYGSKDDEANLYPEINNVVSSVVHLDETTPHLHFKFVPLVQDKKHVGKYKVSAKEAVNKRDLDSFHSDLDRHLEEFYGKGYFPSVRNGVVKEQGGNKPVRHLKQDAVKKLEALEKQIRDLLTEKRRLSSDLAVLRAETEKGENTLKKLKKSVLEANTGLERVLKDLEEAQNNSSLLQKGLKASLEVEELLEKIIPLAEVLEDEYARNVAYDVGRSNKTLKNFIQEADEILGKRSHGKAVGKTTTKTKTSKEQEH